MSKPMKNQALVMIGKHKPNTAEGAARRAGVTKSNLPALGFRGTLAFAVSRVPGGKDVFMEYVRIASDGDESLLELVERWDRLSKSDRRYTRIDDLVESAGLKPSEVLASAARAAFDYNSDVSKMIAAVMQPAVVQTTIEQALTPEGVADRRMLHQHSGFVPLPIGPSINVSARANSNAGKQFNMPSFEEEMLRADEAIRMASSLDSGSEIVDDDDHGDNTLCLEEAKED